MKPGVERARQFRGQMSEPEVMLWAKLKCLRAQGYHFRRQAPLRGYFLDFVCFPRRLVVEVDGSQHGDDRQVEHDAVRDLVLERHGFVVLRFWASDVRRNIGWVLERIVETAEERPSVHAEPGRARPTLAAARPVPPH